MFTKSDMSCAHRNFGVVFILLDDIFRSPLFALFPSASNVLLIFSAAKQKLGTCD